MIDPVDIQATLRLLHRYARGLPGYHEESVNSYMNAGEYYLSMDTIADAFLANSVKMPDKLYLMFENIAFNTGVLDDPEYSGVAEFIARQGGQRSLKET